MAHEQPPHQGSEAHPASRILLTVLPVVFSLLSWIVVGSLFALRSGSSLDLTQLLIVGVVSFVIFLATFAVAVIVDRHPLDHVLLVALTTLSVAASGFSLLTVLVMGVALAGLLLYRKTLQAETLGRIRFSIERTIHAALGFPLSLLLIAVAVQSVAAAQPADVSGTLLKRALNATLAGAERLAPLTLHGYRPEKTIDAYLGELLAGSGAASQPASLPGLVGVNVQTAESVALARQQLGQNLGLTLTGTETLSTVVRSAVERRVEPALTPFSSWLVPLIALSLYLLLRILSPVLWLLTMAVSWAYFRLCLRFGLVQIVQENARVDRVKPT